MKQEICDFGNWFKVSPKMMTSSRGCRCQMTRLTLLRIRRR